MTDFKDYIDAVKQNYSEAENIKFDNFSDLAKFVLMGNEKGPDLIKLELSGLKDGKKEWVKFVGKNMVQILEKYNDTFDKPMTKNMTGYLLDNVMNGMMKALKEQSGKVISSIKVGDETKEQ